MLVVSASAGEHQLARGWREALHSTARNQELLYLFRTMLVSSLSLFSLSFLVPLHILLVFASVSVSRFSVCLCGCLSVSLCLSGSVSYTSIGRYRYAIAAYCGHNWELYGMWSAYSVSSSSLMLSLSLSISRSLSLHYSAD